MSPPLLFRCLRPDIVHLSSGDILSFGPTAELSVNSCEIVLVSDAFDDVLSCSIIQFEVLVELVPFVVNGKRKNTGCEIQIENQFAVTFDVSYADCLDRLLRHARYNDFCLDWRPDSKQNGIWCLHLPQSA